MARMLLRGGFVLTMDGAIGDFPRGDVLVADGVIVAVARVVDVEDAEILDVSGDIVMPGFVDTHRHTWETALRGCAPDASLDDYNRTVIGTYAPRYRPADVYVGNAAGAMECLAAGITTLVDWSHITLTPEHADAAVHALRDAGIRAQYACGPKPLADHWVSSAIPADAHDLRRLRGSSSFSSDDSLLTMGMAARGPRFSSDEVVVHDWRLARELDVPITCHVGHGRHARKFEMVRALDRLGLLGNDTTYVHACLLADDEWRLVADSGGTVSIAPLVELQMGHGNPPASRCLAEGLLPGLSIDVVTSAPGDMFTQMRAVLAQERGWANAQALAEGHPPRRLLSARQVLDMATIDGARVARLADRTGSLTPGKRADIIVIDSSGPNMAPLNNPVAAVVLAADTSNVRHVIVDGVIRKRDGSLAADFSRLRADLEASRDYLLAGGGSADGHPHL